MTESSRQSQRPLTRQSRRQIVEDQSASSQPKNLNNLSLSHDPQGPGPSTLNTNNLINARSTISAHTYRSNEV